MKSDFTYDLVIIGGGISACVFASNYLKNVAKEKKLDLFGSLFIPSKQFIARFKFRPWKEVYISEKYLYALENFFDFTNDLVSFYKKNNITPVIESDFSSSEKIDSVYSFLENER